MVDTISLIAGQKAVVVNAKKSVAGFKAREGAPTGIRVTLRGANMYNFFDKLVSIALPRVKILEEHLEKVLMEEVIITSVFKNN
jgi:large subunit ribosomal protein L5